MQKISRINNLSIWTNGLRKVITEIHITISVKIHNPTHRMIFCPARLFYNQVSWQQPFLFYFIRRNVPGNNIAIIDLSIAGEICSP